MVESLLKQRDALARCLLIAIARRERAGLAPRRLSEPGLATWKQYAGNLELPHLLALLAEDAAVRFPLPADPSRIFGVDTDLADSPAPFVYDWLEQLTPERLDLPQADSLADYARSLDVSARFAGADLHKIQADQRVLELPGTGGQLVARALERSPEATLLANATVLTGSWSDRAMAGLVAMELDAPSIEFIRDDPDLTWASQQDQRQRFDLVFGLKPEKGGRWDKDTLARKLGAATLVLV
jgi:hypothetical protein